MPAKGRVSVVYRNYRGEVSVREITPHRVWYGSTEWHPEPGWLLEAYDAGKNALRDFALADCDFCRADAGLRAEVERLRSLLARVDAALKKGSGSEAVFAVNGDAGEPEWSASIMLAADVRAALSPRPADEEGA